jgi:hypothetical protein
VLFHIYNFRDNHRKNKKKEKINRRLNQQLAGPGRRFKWRHLPGSHSPPNPGLPPLLQTCRPVLRRQVLTATLHGGSSLPPLETAAGAQSPTICANVESAYLFL